MSNAVSDDPGLPPIVPRIPDMLLINATKDNFCPIRTFEFGASKIRFKALYFGKKFFMSAFEWYKNWFSSPYYHKLYFERDDREAKSFIDRILDYLQPAQGSSMIDVACGQGRHARYLAEKGFDVTGIDISLESIQYAQQFEHDRLHFFQHDMRLPAWINYFDHAFNFFTSFGYFHTQREHDDSMRTITQSLKPGGSVLFDYLNVHYVEDRLVHNETKTIGAADYEIRRWQDTRSFFKRIIVRDPSLEQPIDYTEQVAKFSLGDFTDMLAFQKMQVKDVFGDYTLSPYDLRKSPRMIIVARKESGSLA